MNIAVIELGSNISPEYHIKKAIDIIDMTFILAGRSEFIFTKPVGDQNQPDYLNGAVVIKTVLEMTDLKNKLKTIETFFCCNKSASERKGRELDLDIIIWNGEIVHKDYHERDFVRSTVESALLSLASNCECKD